MQKEKERFSEQKDNENGEEVRRPHSIRAFQQEKRIRAFSNGGFSGQGRWAGQIILYNLV